MKYRLLAWTHFLGAILGFAVGTANAFYQPHGTSSLFLSFFIYCFSVMNIIVGASYYEEGYK